MAEGVAALLLVALDLAPVADHVGRRLGLALAEHVRVPADQLQAAVVGHRGEVALAALLEEQRQEHDLEEHVAQLVEHLLVVARLGGVGQLVGLLDRVRHDRAGVLLTIPGALAAEQPRDLVELDERGWKSALLSRQGAT